MTKTLFHSALKNMALELRRDFAEHNLSRLNLQISITGPVDYDSLEIKYTLSDDRYSNEVSGNDIAGCFEEMLRRNGWKSRNQPVQIPYVENEDD